MIDDLRYALRDIRRFPGLTIALVLTLAIGVGVNGAMFTVLDRILIRNPEGVRNASEVRRAYWVGKNFLGTVGYSTWFSAPDFDAFRQAGKGTFRLAGFHSSSAKLLDVDGDTSQFYATGVTPDYFSLLGVTPQRGRVFADDELQYGDPRYVAVLSDAFWRRRFGADSSIIGRTIRLLLERDTTSLTVIGVAQPGFAGVDVDVDELWFPFTARPTAGEGGTAWWTQKGSGVMALIVRIPTGIEPKRVEAQLTAIHHGVNQGARWLDSQARMGLAPLVKAQGPLRGLGSTASAVRDFALATRLGGMSLVVLVLAIANTAALMLMRSLWRQRELAVRLALGVTTSRLARTFLVEGLVITILSATAATFFAYWTGGLLRPLLFASIKWPHHVIDGRLILVVVSMTAVATLAGSIAPFVLVARQDAMSALKAGGHGGGNPASRFRSTFLATQTAICVALLSAAGLFVQSLRKASTVDLGYDPDRLLNVQAFGYRSQNPREAFDELARRLAADPSVQSISRVGLLGGGTVISSLVLNSKDTVPPEKAPSIDVVDGTWAATVGLRVRSGSSLTSDAVAIGVPSAMINRTMAEQYWPGRSPLGDCLGLSYGCIRIIGVYEDLRMNIAQPPKSQYVIAPAPRPDWPHGPAVLARFNRPVNDADVARVREMVTTLVGPTRMQLIVQRANATLERQLRPWRVAAGLLSVFGFVALASAAAGVFGLVAYDVGRRTREIGIRTTLGATPGRVVRDVIRPSLKVIAIGVVVGTGIALLSGRVMASLLFNTSPSDPAVLASAAVALSVVALIAGLLPALRATKVNPIVALNAD